MRKYLLAKKPILCKNIFNWSLTPIFQGSRLEENLIRVYLPENYIFELLLGMKSSPSPMDTCARSYVFKSA